MKMGIQDPHFPGRIGTRVPILPEIWGPGVPILGGPYFHVTAGRTRSGRGDILRTVKSGSAMHRASESGPAFVRPAGWSTPLLS